MIGFCVQLLIRIDEIVQSSKETNKISSNNVFKVFKVCSRISFCCVVCTRMKDHAGVTHLLHVHMHCSQCVTPAL